MKNTQKKRKEKHTSSLTFNEETHTYYKDGIKLRSVTQILQDLFPSKYDDVPRKILENKAEYGTEVHKMIEVIETKKPKNPIKYIKRYMNADIYQEESIKDYLEIKEENKIQVDEVEKMVSYKYLYAGRLDCKAHVNGKSAIIDFKTTYELDTTYVAFQNSLYELADEPVEELYVLWLPRGHKGRLVELKRIDKDILKGLIENV